MIRARKNEIEIRNPGWGKLLFWVAVFLGSLWIEYQVIVFYGR